MNRRKLVKNGGIAVATIAIVIAGAAAFSAFEAHVINVTARIENALSVPTDPINFGTVFPQEELDAQFPVVLSQSFLDEDRVDDVEYIIRQKPKCAITAEEGQILVGPTATGHVIPLGEGQYRVDCGEPPRLLEEGETWDVLPLLCPYLSKHEQTTDGTEEENDGQTLAFHQPFTVTSTTIEWLDTPGRLAKSVGDTEDLWNLDLKVPCFGDHCAQDWEEFVLGINPDVNPDDYVQPIENEHKIFGCDIWIEVGHISLPPDDVPPTLTVTKVIVGETASTSVDFSFTIDDDAPIAFEADGTNVITPIAAGPHDVDEVPAVGFSTTIGGPDCDSDGNVTVPVSGNATCIITNTVIVDENGTLIVNKIVDNSDGIGTNDAEDFSFSVNGEASTPFEADGSNSMDVPAGDYDVVEDADAGYTTTYSNSLNANADCNDLTVPSGGPAVTCTITNTAIFGTITVTKEVDNGDGGDAEVGDFDLFVDATSMTSGTPKKFAPGSYAVSENGQFGYSAEFTGDCDDAGNITLAEGESLICTIINDDIKPSITLVKVVSGGSAAPDDFDLSIDGSVKSSGSSTLVSANAPHEIDEEVLVSGYTFTSITGSSFLGVPCPVALEGSITLAPGDVVTCTITNTFTP